MLLIRLLMTLCVSRCLPITLVTRLYKNEFLLQPLLPVVPCSVLAFTVLSLLVSVLEFLSPVQVPAKGSPRVCIGRFAE